MFENNYDYVKHAELTSRFRSGANWFYWIAGLTLVTSVISLMDGNFGFFLSLGITQLIDGFAVYFAGTFGEATKVVAIVLDIFITALFIGFGYLSNKRHLGAYLAGIILFGLDSLLTLVIVDILGLIIHCVALVLMIRGYIAGREMLALEREMAAVAPQPTF
ncbi:MAG TPA: hypothetical protein VN844_05725 [Pyrinomonadaceae bacterium]|nr:hypothetical protein [Pyrinomonadaceae bacterium]